MANGILIPITVDFKNSLQKLNDTRKAVDGLGTDAAKTIKILSAAPSTGGLKAVADNTQSVKTQLRQANIELQNLIQQFGAASPQVQAAAARVEELGDVIEEARLATESADLGGKFAVAGKAIAGVSSAFQTATALQAVFGDKSKETEEALKKVQAVMALTQGIQGVIEARKSLVALGSAGADVFTKLVTSITAATGASRALSAAIAATGIGLLAVGIGLLVGQLQELNAANEDATESTKKLKEANDKLKDSLDDVRKSSQSYVNGQVKLIQNEEKIKDLQAAGGDNQKEINRLRRENLDISIKADQVELATKQGLLTATEELALKEKIFRNEQEKSRIAIEENAKATEKANEILKQRADAIANVGKELRSSLQDIDIAEQLGAGPNLEGKLKAIQTAISKYLKLGFSIDSKQIQDLLQQAAGLKIKLFKPVVLQTSFDLQLQELENKEAVKKEVEDKLSRFRDLKPILPTELQAPVFIRTEVVPPDPDKLKKVRDTIIEDQEAFQEKYTALVESGLEDAFEAFGAAIGEGADPFAALAKSIGLSIANFATTLGRDLVTLGTLFQALQKTLSTLGPGGKIAVGLALIAFGAAVKSAISKRGKEQGFATGGFVSGPGTETSDSIPARLSRGEYVINARAVRRLGKGFFDGINNNTGLRFFNGGIVDSFRQYTRNGGTSKALVNRFEIPDLNQMSNPAMPRMSSSTEPQIIATTKVSGQDLKIILERADKRYLSVT